LLMLNATRIESTQNVNRVLAPTAGFGSEYSVRRLFVATLTTVSMLGTTFILVAILSRGSLGFIAYLAVAAFLVNMTWVALSFWNSVIGFLVLRDFGKPSTKIGAELEGSETRNALDARTAVVMTIRDDDVDSVFARIKATRKSLEKTGSAALFDYFILSDTSVSEAIEAEQSAISLWQAEDASVKGDVFYRHRPTNSGFKAGNIRDFCAKWGSNYEFMILLDADSLMSGDTILRLVAIMQNQPRLGILQTLVVGVLCPSLFARLFEFGRRHALRCSLAGAAWWQRDRCQCWGHNLVIRVAPFMRYCETPLLPGKGPFSGHIHCHDQIEASFMHRAGYEVRVLTEESGSYEGVPPTLYEFNKRNNRWCEGNLKNARVVRHSSLPAIDRFHLLVVAQRFLSQPALVIFVLAVAVWAASWPIGKAPPAGLVLSLYLMWMAMFFSPKLLGIADAILNSPSKYGGTGRLLLGASVELLYSLFLTPISAIATTAHLIKIPFESAFNWDSNRRSAYALTLGAAVRVTWLQSVVGVTLLIYLIARSPAAILWFAPFWVGLILAVPFAMLTSSSGANDVARRWRLCILPEEIEVPPEIADVARFEGNPV
jgi:membrane glycosyltransferase